jgi:hypothetical protein
MAFEIVFLEDFFLSEFRPDTTSSQRCLGAMPASIAWICRHTRPMLRFGSYLWLNSLCSLSIVEEKKERKKKKEEEEIFFTFMCPVLTICLFEFTTII